MLPVVLMSIYALTAGNSTGGAWKCGTPLGDAATAESAYAVRTALLETLSRSVAVNC
jgi:hypothetical protein